MPEAFRKSVEENSGDWRLSLQGPVGEPVESLTEYFWRAPEREHLSVRALLGELLSGDSEGYGERAEGMDFATWGSINGEL